MNCYKLRLIYDIHQIEYTYLELQRGAGLFIHHQLRPDKRLGIELLLMDPRQVEHLPIRLTAVQ